MCHIQWCSREYTQVYSVYMLVLTLIYVLQNQTSVSNLYSAE